MLRETFLWRFRENETRKAVIHLAEFADAMMWEYGEGGGDGPPLFLEFTALAADLQHLAAYLQRIAAGPEEFPEHPREYVICCAAAQWSAREAEVVEEIQAAMVTTWGSPDAA